MRVFRTITGTEVRQRVHVYTHHESPTAWDTLNYSSVPLVPCPWWRGSPSVHTRKCRGAALPAWHVLRNACTSATHIFRRNWKQLAVYVSGKVKQENLVSNSRYLHRKKATKLTLRALSLFPRYYLTLNNVFDIRFSIIGSQTLLHRWLCHWALVKGTITVYRISLPSIPLSIAPHDDCCEKFGKNIPLKPLPVSSFPQKCICNNHVIQSWMSPLAWNAKVPMHTTEVFSMVGTTRQEESTFRTLGCLFWMAGDFVLPNQESLPESMKLPSFPRWE